MNSRQCRCKGCTAENQTDRKDRIRIRKGNTAESGVVTKAMHRPEPDLNSVMETNRRQALSTTTTFVLHLDRAVTKAMLSHTYLT